MDVELKHVFARERLWLLEEQEESTVDRRLLLIVERPIMRDSRCKLFDRMLAGQTDCFLSVRARDSDDGDGRFAPTSRQCVNRILKVALCHR